MTVSHQINVCMMVLYVCIIFSCLGFYIRKLESIVCGKSKGTGRDIFEELYRFIVRLEVRL